MTDIPADQPFVSSTQLIVDHLSRTPGRTVLTDPRGFATTAGQLRDEICQLARELADRGACRDATVSLLTSNTRQAVVARLAVGLTGARIVYIPCGWSPQPLAELITAVDTQMLAVDPARAAEATQILNLVDVKDVYSLGTGPCGEDIMARAARRPTEPATTQVGPEDTLMIRLTGGTTGFPKGIPVTHGAYRATVLDAGQRLGHPDARLLVCTPLSHFGGGLADLVLMYGGSIVLQETFDADAVLTAIENERITHVWLMPSMINELLDHPRVAEADLSSLTHVVYGGCMASAARLRRAIDVLGPVLHATYGMSEAGPLTFAGPRDHLITGGRGRITAGRPLPGVQIEVRDNAGCVCPPGQAGELYVRSDHLMSGYWKNPELTAQVLRDGWYRTGDVGYLENGYLFLVDRLNDKIIVSAPGFGQHVYASALEDLLLAHPAVRQCAVFAIRDDDAVEHIHAAVALAPTQHLDLAAVRSYVTSRHEGVLPAPEKLHVLPALPFTPEGKPDKARLRTRVLDAVAPESTH